MYSVGITGGVASGKSTVARILSKLGAGSIDTDCLAREAVRPETKCHQALIDEFGDSILLTDGEVDRALLRQLVFASDEKRKKLEHILHPEILTLMRKALAEMTTEYAVVEVPLLVENSLQSEFDRILVVDCPVEVQLDRLEQRDRASEANAQKMIATQASRQQRLDAADDVVCNDSSMEELSDRVSKLHSQYLEFARTKKTSNKSHCDSVSKQPK